MNNKRHWINKQAFLFLGVFFVILFAWHFYLFERISYYLQLTERPRIFLAALLSSISFLTVAVMGLSRVLPRKVVSILSWIIYPWIGIAFLLLATLLVADISWFLLKRIIPDHFFNQAFLEYCYGMTALSVACLLGGYSFWKGFRVTVKPVNIELYRLPKSFDGFRIVQISDLHVGPLINGNWLRGVVDKVNALKPDLIVITGDLVDGSVKELRHDVAPIADLQALHGTYFITGNHEYYSGADDWCTYIATLGVHILRNARVSIKRHSTEESFDLAGVDDWASRHFPGEGPNLLKALVNRDVDKTLILLAHQPLVAHQAARQGVDLQLSGHTHGGQIWPFTYLVYLQQPYTQGLYRHGNTQTQIYVSPGTGFWGPPMRLGTSAEITHITLRAARS